jgi:hypothetical protein
MPRLGAYLCNLAFVNIQSGQEAMATINARPKKHRYFSQKLYIP